MVNPVSTTTPRSEADVLETFRVDGMTCQNCARKAREAAESVAGVSRATVDLGRGDLILRWAAGSRADSEAVIAAVSKAGFRAELRAAEASDRRGSAWMTMGKGWGVHVALGGAVTAVLMFAEWVAGWHHESWYGRVALVLALPVQIFCGARFYRGAWSQLRRGTSSMDTLVALGSTSAFAYSLWVLFAGRGGHLYFMESAAILTLIGVGHWLEAIASERAAGAVRALASLAPSAACRLGDRGEETTIDAAALLPGDRIVLAPGDRVPTDGVVEDGVSAMDEAMLTGEAKPVEKVSGAKVFAGTTNLDGRLVVRVNAIGESTALGRILAAVERAQNSRAEIQRLADTVSAVFVPAVIVLALVTAAVWGLAPDAATGAHAWLARFLWTVDLPATPLEAAVVHATAVLIVACPCAMGLATPAAIMAGTNAAALHGILVRDGIALEKAGRIDTVIFDKTGTLTEGRLNVVETRDLRSEAERGESLASIAASVARGSNHPVSRALAAGVESMAPMPVPGSGTTAKGSPVRGGFPQPLPTLASPTATARKNAPNAVGSGMLLRSDMKFVPRGQGGAAWLDWREHRGCGVEARRAGDPAVYRLGAPSWLEECGVVGARSVVDDGEAGARLGTRVGLAAGTRLLGWFRLEDCMRPEAAALVAGLRADGMAVYLLSGDAWLAAEAVAKEVGIPAEYVMGSVRPEQKSDAIERLQREGRRVAFVGDGLNDGPALARADLGIAVGKATDVARESADVVLVHAGLERVREAMELARATLRTIRQNLFWAFFYNAAAVPLAMAGFFAPVVCAAAMGLSDLLVVGNAMRLRFWSTRGGRFAGGGSAPRVRPGVKS